jgi:hypothetical protein
MQWPVTQCFTSATTTTTTTTTTTMNETIPLETALNGHSVITTSSHICSVLSSTTTLRYIPAPEDTEVIGVTRPTRSHELSANADQSLKIPSTTTCHLGRQHCSNDVTLIGSTPFQGMQQPRVSSGKPKANPQSPSQQHSPHAISLAPHTRTGVPPASAHRTENV